MLKLPVSLIGSILVLSIGECAPLAYLQFNGTSNYVEVPNSPDFSLGQSGLTVAAWIRPGTLSFPKTEGSLTTEQYIYWLGKGDKGQQEWAFRMYSQTSPPGPRANRISFYVFNRDGGRGCGSYFQDPVSAGQWVHVVGVIDAATQKTSIFKNGSLRHSDSYGGTIAPAHGTAPLRMATRNLASFLQGALGQIRIWNRPLTATEVHDFYTSNVVPQNGLVAQYLLDESSGTVVHDSGGQSHDGSVVGASWKTDGNLTVNTTTGQSGGGC